MCAGARSARITEAYSSSMTAMTAVHTGRTISLTLPCFLPTRRQVQMPATIVRNNSVTMMVLSAMGRDA